MTAAGPVALYLHVPFCVRKCAYCDFASTPMAHGDPAMAAYARSLAGMAGQARALGLLDAQRTAYLGGGTPTLLGPAGLAGLMAAACGPNGAGEASFEANPESLSAEALARARDAGATRVSVGVQSLWDEELRALGRVHDGAGALRALEAAASSGLRVSADLMGAVPHQTPRTLARSVQGVVDAGAGHVSVYPLQLEEGTALARAVERGELRAPDPDEEADAMERAEACLTAAGLLRYEVASYALRGQRCRHNLAYWDGSEYLGLGTAAASMLGRASYDVLRRAAPGLPPMPEGAARARLCCASDAAAVARANGHLGPLAWETEFLSAAEAAAEDLMLAARTSDGIGRPLADRAAAELGAARVSGCLAGLEKRGLLTFAGDAWRPTEQGWLLGNLVFGELWGLAGTD